MEGKLVRDKIPLLVIGEYYKCSEEEYTLWLRLKLAEEVMEYLANPTPEELADVVEVVLKLLELHGKEVINELLKKREERGSLDKCWIMLTD